MTLTYDAVISHDHEIAFHDFISNRSYANNIEKNNERQFLESSARINGDISFHRIEERNVLADLDASMDITDDRSQHLNVFVRWVRFTADDGKLRRMLDSPLSQFADLAHTKRTFLFGQK